MTAQGSLDVPEPLRTALRNYVWSELDSGVDLTQELQAGLDDPHHWTTLLVPQVTSALLGTDPDVLAALVASAEDRLPLQIWPPGQEPVDIDPQDTPTRIAVLMTQVLNKLPWTHPLVLAQGQDGERFAAPDGIAVLDQPWPAPEGATEPTATNLLPARLYVSERAAIAEVWPAAQDGEPALARRFPGLDPNRLLRQAENAVAAAHLSGLIGAVELAGLGHRSDPTHPCGVDLAYEGFPYQLDSLRKFHGHAARDAREYAVEWSRHETWWLLSQDEDLVVLSDLGVDNVRAALEDPDCRKREYMLALLDHIDAPCGSPGCLSCSKGSWPH